VDELSEAIRLLVENINSKEIILSSRSEYGIVELRIDMIYINHILISKNRDLGTIQAQ